MFEKIFDSTISDTTCKGKTSKGKQCDKKVKQNGYCALHYKMSMYTKCKYPNCNEKCRDLFCGKTHKDRCTPKKYTINQLETAFNRFKTIRQWDIEESKETPNIRGYNMKENISENIIKFALQNLNKNVHWAITGDLFEIVNDEYKFIQCKSTTLKGPISFSPVCCWDYICVLDTSMILLDKFKLYIINITSKEFNTLKCNKKLTFNEQRKGGKRPRIDFNQLLKQISPDKYTVQNFTFQDLKK